MPRIRNARQHVELTEGRMPQRAVGTPPPGGARGPRTKTELQQRGQQARQEIRQGADPFKALADVIWPRD